MSCAVEDGFHLAYKLDHLSRVVVFLESGFGWDSKRSQAILKHFEHEDVITPKAAFFSENGEIKIAILLFNQADIESNSKKIINLSSWYAEESHRGVEAIRFIKKLTLKLCDYTITNYTPSAAVKKVLLALGYKQMSVEMVTLRILRVVKNFPYVQLGTKKMNFTFTQSAVEPTQLTFEKNINIYQPTYQVVTERKIGFNFGILNIYLPKDKSFISPFWLVKFCLLHGVMKVNVYSETDSINKESPWLIKSFNDESYVHPWKSELSIS